MRVGLTYHTYHNSSYCMNMYNPIGPKLISNVGSSQGDTPVVCIASVS